MPNYVVTAKKFAGKEVGSVIELTAEQAASPLYRNRVRVSDDQAKLEVATPSLDKKEVIEKLRAAKIDFDGRKSAEELAELLPK